MMLTPRNSGRRSASQRAASAPRNPRRREDEDGRCPQGSSLSRFGGVAMMRAIAATFILAALCGCRTTQPSHARVNGRVFEVVGVVQSTSRHGFLVFETTRNSPMLVPGMRCVLVRDGRQYWAGVTLRLQKPVGRRMWLADIVNIRPFVPIEPGDLVCRKPPERSVKAWNQTTGAVTNSL